MAEVEYKNISRISVSLIDGADPADESVVMGLADSIREIGLMNPVWVSPVKNDRGTTERYLMIAGRHRVAAARLLGWEHIDARIVNLYDLRAELAMIDENLVRRVLGPADTALLTARRKEIYEAIHPETRHGGDRKSDQVADSAVRSDSFVAATARATGKAGRTVRLRIRISRPRQFLPKLGRNQKHRETRRGQVVRAAALTPLSESWAYRRVRRIEQSRSAACRPR